MVFKDDYLPVPSFLLGSWYLLLNNENEMFYSLCLLFVLGNLIGICPLFIVASVSHAQLRPDLYFVLALHALS